MGSELSPREPARQDEEAPLWGCVSIKSTLQTSLTPFFKQSLSAFSPHDLSRRYKDLRVSEPQSSSSSDSSWPRVLSRRSLRATKQVPHSAGSLPPLRIASTRGRPIRTVGCPHPAQRVCST